MKKNFGRFGISQVCVSDNGPQFSSHECLRFTSEYGFEPIKSSPYHIESNAKAESAVKVAKNILKKSRNEDPYLALLAHRDTPQQDQTYSPAQRIMSRKLRDISVSIPNQVKPNPKNKHKPWIFGEVAENQGQRSCVVQISGGSRVSQNKL